jgi:hypothetical protein
MSITEINELTRLINDKPIGNIFREMSKSKFTQKIDEVAKFEKIKFISLDLSSQGPVVTQIDLINLLKMAQDNLEEIILNSLNLNNGFLPIIIQFIENHPNLKSISLENNYFR